MDGKSTLASLLLSFWWKMLSQFLLPAVILLLALLYPSCPLPHHNNWNLFGLPCFTSFLHLSVSKLAPHPGFPFPDRSHASFLLLFNWCFHYITSSSVCFSLLHLPLPPHDYLPFLALLSLKQAIFPLWRKCSAQSLGMVLNSHCSQSLLQLPQRELSRYIFSCQRVKVLRRILYFCQSFSIVTTTYPDHIS